MILVGPSGCGKSTLLRMIVGLEDITSGEMIIGGKVVNNVAPRERNLSMVFQNYALYPHLTVFENIAFPLRLAKVPDDEVQRRVKETAELLELTEHLDRKPANLSGGQRQRVAMGRAIVRQADAFLFDEPLSNLDAKLRGQMRAEISRLQRRLGITTVYVTHDQTEAMTLGDRVAVLRKGELQQVGSAARAVRGARQPVRGGVHRVAVDELPARRGTRRGRDGPRHAARAVRAARPAQGRGGRRPRDRAGRDPSGALRGRVADQRGEAGEGRRLRVVVDVTEWLGNELYAYVPYEAPADLAAQLRDLSRELDSDQLRTQAVVALDASSMITPGREAELWIDPAKAHIFDPATGRNLTRDEERAARLGRMADEARAAQRSAQREAPGGGREDGAEDGAVDGGTAGASAAET